jgi:hypothetical protein
MAKEIDVPEELKILLPDLNKGVILVGSKAYEILPLNEGQLERIISDVTDVFEKINCPDGQCATCGKVVKLAGPRRIYKCPDDGDDLVTMNQSPVEAILKSSKVPQWVELITGVPEEEAKAHMTLNQMKHFAGVFWRQNFSDEGLPEVSRANFKKLLEMMNKGESTTPSPAEKTKSESPPPA